MASDVRRLPGPFSFGAGKADTHGVERVVLMVTHHLASATRLADIVHLVEEDHRVQVAYTVPPSSRYANGAHDYLRDAGLWEMPWSQAVELPWDLVVSAGDGMLERLHGPIMTLTHGIGPNGYVDRRDSPGPAAPRAIPGFGQQALTMYGRVISSAIMLGHEDHLPMLAAACPEALPASVVAGDPCFDRILASRGRRTAYRNALGASPDQQVVVVSSHHGSESLMSRHPELLTTITRELPSDRYRVVLAMHPNIWSAHGKSQIRAWFSASIEAGAVLLPPEEGWRAALVAADLLFADHSSVVCYGAALGLPTLLAPFAAEDVLPGSVFARLTEMAPALDPKSAVADQLDEALRAWSPANAATLRAQLTSVPGGAAREFRRVMYRLLGLAEPRTEPLTRPVLPPRPLEPLYR
ncbi:hypothetical protein Skr01_02840 [Sphaerisporangium krabiense]|uniref:UDP-N-acetylglucosamine 2-epimerase domain-containing protein n=1 Tax=Sphaerisporangium krabiense TaxID=763782 RepID=A0A7W9DT22_9ACTN|nr:hypothetical protein [Sphaerisporangium krabiense]MBB5628960.1 hypothetical protein [Sphaerisporangium krabiense]GII60199.1 hypothetical protein Skr01_02840 [Sphaerisporangium krabiense]